MQRSSGKTFKIFLAFRKMQRRSVSLMPRQSAVGECLLNTFETTVNGFGATDSRASRRANFDLRLSSSSSSSSSLHQLGLDRPVTASFNSLFKVFRIVFVHLVQNSTLFLASCCCSPMLHLVANLPWSKMMKIKEEWRKCLTKARKMMMRSQHHHAV